MLNKGRRYMKNIPAIVAVAVFLLSGQVLADVPTIKGDKGEVVDYHQHIKRPVIHAFHYPVAKGKTDYKTWNMQSVTSVDVRDAGTNAAEAYWRGMGKVILERVYLQKYYKDSSGTFEERVAYVLSKLSAAAAGRMGISWDEMGPTSPMTELDKVCMAALERFRNANPAMIIMVWGSSGITEQNKPMFEMVNRCADFYAQELYIPQSQGNRKDYWRGIHKKYKSDILRLDKMVPGIMSKLLLTIAIHDKMRDLPSQPFSEYLQAYIDYFVSEPLFKRCAGLAIYAPSYAPAEELAILDKAILEKFIPYYEK
jgi:hypothetical protein